jgi:hypothetical protein
VQDKQKKIVAFTNELEEIEDRVHAMSEQSHFEKLITSEMNAVKKIFLLWTMYFHNLLASDLFKKIVNNFNMIHFCFNLGSCWC